MLLNCAEKRQSIDALPSDVRASDVRASEMRASRMLANCELWSEWVGTPWDTTMPCAGWCHLGSLGARCQRVQAEAVDL
ncbi:hypothetical protein OVA07_00165 [Novosphingobium sp. SL115]|uniref:hypothetical protein n=1 Tax=Novosphingobium sp. SL115 TaxID=2995150 RepID=UPI00227530D7|nr:hypothetical protein [Novosphingobium sp. SL115]MCY1669443.1 hypothetical protein [Novosphingobium sp. SL115]